MEDLIACVEHDDSKTLNKKLNKFEVQSVLTFLKNDKFLVTLLRNNAMKCFATTLKYLQSKIDTDQRYEVENVVRVRSSGITAAEMLIKKIDEKEVEESILLDCLDKILFDLHGLPNVGFRYLYQILKLNHLNWNKRILDSGTQYLQSSDYKVIDANMLNMLLEAGLIQARSDISSSLLSYFISNSKVDLANLLIDACCIKTSTIKLDTLYYSTSKTGGGDYINRVLEHHFQHDKNTFIEGLQLLTTTFVQNCFKDELLYERRWNSFRDDDGSEKKKVSTEDPACMEASVLRQWLEKDEVQYKYAYLRNLIGSVRIGRGAIASLLCNKYFKMISNLRSTPQPSSRVSDDVLAIIGSNLQAKDAISLSMTCSSARKMMFGESFNDYWRSKVEQTWPGSTAVHPRVWRLKYVFFISKGTPLSELYHNKTTKNWTWPENTQEVKFSATTKHNEDYTTSTKLSFQSESNSFCLEHSSVDEESWKHWVHSTTYTGSASRGVGDQTNCIILNCSSCCSYTSQAKDPKHRYYSSEQVFRAWLVKKNGKYLIILDENGKATELSEDGETHVVITPTAAPAATSSKHKKCVVQ